MGGAHIFLREKRGEKGRTMDQNVTSTPKSALSSDSHTMCVLDPEELAPSQSLVENGTQDLGHLGKHSATKPYSVPKPRDPRKSAHRAGPERELLAAEPGTLRDT